MGHGLARLILTRSVVEQAPVERGFIGVCRTGQIATVGVPMMESSRNVIPSKHAIILPQLHMGSVGPARGQSALKGPTKKHLHNLK